MDSDSSLLHTYRLIDLFLDSAPSNIGIRWRFDLIRVSQKSDDVHSSFLGGSSA